MIGSVENGAKSGKTCTRSHRPEQDQADRDRIEGDGYDQKIQRHGQLRQGQYQWRQEHDKMRH